MILKKGNSKLLIGWEEWCHLPDLGLPAIKAKIDTGARTSALHAFDIKSFTNNGELYVRFKIHPIQRNQTLTKQCIAKVIDKRNVMSSNGHREWRYVINTTLQLGANHAWPIEVTLSNRDPLSFRMLLGRQALSGKVTIDPGRSFVTKKIKKSALLTLYSAH